jgi:hypothetical protein
MIPLKSNKHIVLKILRVILIPLLLVSAFSCCAPSESPALPLPPNPPTNPEIPVTPEPVPETIPEPANTLPKAAIIDQLSVLNPNDTFLNETTQELENYGFEVDVHQGDEITIDFYRNLPQMDYQLIIFRAHSGLLSGDEGVVRMTTLFTNEAYSETKHVMEQLNDRVAKARIDTKHPMIFSIKDSFITKSMEGDFNNTVIIMMGCSCIAIDDLAQAFINKGASSYMAWHATVGLGYVDQATEHLLQQLCGERATIAEAVSNTMKTIGADPMFGAKLKFFPSQSGDKSLESILGF